MNLLVLISQGLLVSLSLLYACSTFDLIVTFFILSPLVIGYSYFTSPNTVPVFNSCSTVSLSLIGSLPFRGIDITTLCNLYTVTFLLLYVTVYMLTPWLEYQYYLVALINPVLNYIVT